MLRRILNNRVYLFTRSVFDQFILNAAHVCESSFIAWQRLRCLSIHSMIAVYPYRNKFPQFWSNFVEWILLFSWWLNIVHIRAFIRGNWMLLILLFLDRRLHKVFMFSVDSTVFFFIADNHFGNFKSYLFLQTLFKLWKNNPTAR